MHTGAGCFVVSCTEWAQPLVRVVLYGAGDKGYSPLPNLDYTTQHCNLTRALVHIHNCVVYEKILMASRVAERVAPEEMGHFAIRVEEKKHLA